ncbi:exodeoxyribonuclease V, gamma subunit [Oceanimonas sp. GK1]|uniref:exodeoxyribonuclease V subunit gamma n=1 Tax=Oceanimonas sp. (strain GK1 / IBRC-M 10197) TaxID=511062 RepID=UPI000249551B|nr:exodeoxyribonuclease V subunit gamma [Oceanimonas sp. GK1]AEY02026.1 exodeoxyribonuclease V, gamma subunit [Oceanimonas sp. GK1]
MNHNEGLSPGLMVVHGNHLEALRELAVTWMRRYPLEPLENEVILVQSNGIAQWLKLALAEHRSGGIAAAVQVELPARFLWQSYRGVLGSDTIPRLSPLDKAPLTWRLMRLLPALVTEPVFAPLERFLQNDGDGRKRYQLAERLADLFDQYQVYRADWLAAWRDGRDVILHGRRGEQPLDEAVLWQPALWRALLADVGEQELAGSRAGVHPRFVRHVRECEQRPAGLPRRVVVFGISSLPTQTLEALAAMARFSQVLLCVHNPCQHHWGDIVPDQDLLRHQYRRHASKAGQAPGLSEVELHQHAHPLLAAWGKQGRDYINLLDSLDDPDSYRQRFDALGSRIDLFDDGDTGHLLGQLQDDILNLRPPAESREHWPPLTRSQLSVEFHLGHSAQREVEILHDQLLVRFSEDPSLRPRDIIVMVPDINVYAPHIQAVFGQYERDDDRFIPYTLADQGSRGSEPLLIALEHLLRLPESRLPVSEVLDLLDVAALRRRFGINEADLPVLRRWIEGAGVRWGLDARRRAGLGLPGALEQNTWRFGLRRMLLGYAVGAGEAWAGIEPYDEVGGLDAAMIGPLASLLEAIDALHDALSEPVPADDWSARLLALLARFFEPDSEREQALVADLTDALEQWQALCAGVDLDEPLPLTVVREAWLGAVDQGRLSQRFLAGAVNFCTLMPMRAIPFRRVCLLGMNDGDYPRSVTPLDFDLMAGDYRPGDRSRREDDRYLLLEALLSAREGLYISWVGRSIRDNSERPPSVLVGQLRDHLSGWRLADGGKLLEAITTEHPLQPFSRRYFTEGSPLLSYAREWVQAEVTDSVETPLPAWQPDGPVALEQLQQFLRQPVATFFARRLKVVLDDSPSAEQDEEPFALNGLERYVIKRELLEAAAGADEPEAALARAAARLQGQGRLPLVGFGERLRAEVQAALPEQLTRYRALCQTWPTPLTSPLPLAFEHDGLPLEGWLGGLRQSGDKLALIELQPGDLQSGNSLRWHRLLWAFVAQGVACACGIELTLYLVGEDVTLHGAPLERKEAAGIVQGWLEALRAGMTAPLPVALKTAMSALEQKDPAKAEPAARKTYEGDGFHYAGERAESGALARQFPDFDALNADGRFAAWSEQLYRPLLEYGPQPLSQETPS